MCICDKIEVAKTAIDETTILEIKAIITLHSYLKFDKVSCAIKAKKSAKKCAARSGFKILVSNSKAALPFKTILNTTKATISLKSRRFYGKRATKTTFAGTLTRRGLILTWDEVDGLHWELSRILPSLESSYQAFKTQKNVFHKFGKCFKKILLIPFSLFKNTIIILKSFLTDFHCQRQPVYLKKGPDFVLP